ncbi:hypothetical protein RHS03_08305, partial [Rhizoctonia solani]
MHLTRRRPTIDPNDSWVHVTAVGSDMDSSWRIKSLPNTPFSTPPEEKELEDLFRTAKDSSTPQAATVPVRGDDRPPRGDLSQLIGQGSCTLPKPGGHRPVYALAISIVDALAVTHRIATAIAQPEFTVVVSAAPPEPVSEVPPPSPPPSPPRPDRPANWPLLSPINTRVPLHPIQVPQLDNSSDPVTPISDELKTPSSTYVHGVLVSPILESPISEKIQAYINAYVSTIPIENMRTLETILEDEDDTGDSDAESEHTIVPRDRILDTPVTQSSIYSFHTANASIPTTPVSFFEHDWKRR